MVRVSGVLIETKYSDVQVLASIFHYFSKHLSGTVERRNNSVP